MRRERGLPLGIAVVGLVAGWLVLRVLTGDAGAGTRPYREAVGFAVATPAGLVVLSYLADVFRFEAYYAERGPSGVAVDFAIAVVVAVATGLAATAAGVQLGVTPLALFLVATTSTFVAAAASFLVRTRGWQDWRRDDAE